MGIDMTPFLEGPSLEINIHNNTGELAASLNVIETNDPNFSLTMHLRDSQPTDQYHLQVVLYFAKPGEDKLIVEKQTAVFDITRPGDQIIYQTS